MHLKAWDQTSRSIPNTAIVQSMSRRENCWDNAPMESFFLKPSSFTTASTPIAMPRGATCSPMSKATTIGNGDTPRSGTSPLNKQRQKQHNPVPTFLGEGHSRVDPSHWHGNAGGL